LARKRNRPHLGQRNSRTLVNSGRAPTRSRRAGVRGAPDAENECGSARLRSASCANLLCHCRIAYLIDSGAYSGLSRQTMTRVADCKPFFHWQFHRIRVVGYEPRGRGFESCQARHSNKGLGKPGSLSFGLGARFVPFSRHFLHQPQRAWAIRIRGKMVDCKMGMRSDHLRAFPST